MLDLGGEGPGCARAFSDELTGSAREVQEKRRRREHPLLVKTGKGDSFVVSHADEFATEVEILRRNHDFLTMLADLCGSIPVVEAGPV